MRSVVIPLATSMWSELILIYVRVLFCVTITVIAMQIAQSPLSTMSVIP